VYSCVLYLLVLTVAPLFLIGTMRCIIIIIIIRCQSYRFRTFLAFSPMQYDHALTVFGIAYPRCFSRKNGDFGEFLV
jgi:hypothetical protein